MSASFDRSTRSTAEGEMSSPQRKPVRVATVNTRTGRRSTGRRGRAGGVGALIVKNEVYCRYLFHTRVQENGESAEDFVSALKTLAAMCGFESQRERLIRDRVVVGVRHDQTRRRLLWEPSLTLDQCLEICRQDETASWRAEMAQKRTSSADSASREKEVGSTGSFSGRGGQVDMAEDEAPRKRTKADDQKTVTQEEAKKAASTMQTKNPTRQSKGPKISREIEPRGEATAKNPREVTTEASGEISPACNAFETAGSGSEHPLKSEEVASLEQGVDLSCARRPRDTPQEDIPLASDERNPSAASSHRKRKAPPLQDSQAEHTPGTGASTEHTRGIGAGAAEQTDSPMDASPAWDGKAKASRAPGDSSPRTQQRFACHVCGKDFRTAASLGKHRQAHFGPPVRGPQTCPFCGKVCKNKSVLLIHMRTHTDERPYVCDLCGLGFKRKDCLEGHRVTHTGQRRCECEVCGRVFMKPEYLAQHRRLHTGEKKYACEICGKRFHRSGGLLIHMRYHTNERPYVCETCGKAYVKLSHLKVHAATVHVEEGTIPCGLCPKMFKTKQQARRHETLHQGERRFVCEVCGAGFMRSTHLAQHARTHARQGAKEGSGSELTGERKAVSRPGQKRGEPFQPSPGKDAGRLAQDSGEARRLDQAPPSTKRAPRREAVNLAAWLPGVVPGFGVVPAALPPQPSTKSFTLASARAAAFVSASGAVAVPALCVSAVRGTVASSSPAAVIPGMPLVEGGLQEAAVDLTRARQEASGHPT